MLLSVVGTDDAVEAVVRQLSGAEQLTNVRELEGEGRRGFAARLGFDEETWAEVEVVVHSGPTLAECVAGRPQGAADAVLYAVDLEEQAHDVADAQDALGKRQPPFAVVVKEEHTEEVIDECFARSRWFLGGYSASADDAYALLWSLFWAARYPAHVLWDRPENNFTPVGWRALQRLFWFHDRDLDDALSQQELLRLLQAVRGPAVDVAAVRETVQLVREQQEELCIDASSPFVNADGNITHYAWMSLCEGWLGSPDDDDYWPLLRGLWNALEESGVARTGQAWTADDLRSVRIDPMRDMLQLSFSGAEFLAKVYREKFASESAMWRFTPSTQYSAAGEPPWADVSGLPGSREDPQEYSCEAFVACWRFMAVRKHQSLIVFARCWGFADDPNVLFVKKKKHAFRQSDVDLPNILQCLVLGSPRCGKTALRKRMADVVTTPEDPYVKTTEQSITLVPQKSGETEQFDLVLHEVPDKDVATLLDDPVFMGHIDAVLLCYDSDDVYSFSYIAEKLPVVKKHKVPMLLVMTKVDLLGEGLCNLQDQEYHLQPHEFATRTGLCWPPAMVTSYPATSLTQVNDVDDLPLSISMLCRSPEEHIGREESSLCCRIAKISLCTSALLGSIVTGALALRRRS